MQAPSPSQETINAHEWRSDENWTRLGLYRSVRDTRVWVPKRKPAFGWTVNLAHPAGWWSLLALFTVPLGLILLFALVQLFK